MGSQRAVDLVIVGAAAAGLGAAGRAGELGLSYIVCEAMDRIGGRAHTDTATFGTPCDRGCHLLHSGSVNPFAKIANQYGFHYEQTQPVRRSFDGSRWIVGDEQAELERHVYGHLWGAMERAGKDGKDISAADVVDLQDPWIAILRTALAGEW